MLECLIVGDSIAYGIAQYRPECANITRVGWNSRRWNLDFTDSLKEKSASRTIISLGINDYQGIKTEKELRKLRKNIKTGRVYWISPGSVRKPELKAIIEKIAFENGDVVLPWPEKHISPDAIHPTQQGYKILADYTKP